MKKYVSLKEIINYISPWLLAILSGCLSILCFPPYYFSSLAYLFLIPLLLSFQGQHLLYLFFLGFLQGLVFSLGLLYWIKIFHILALPFLCFYFSLFMGIFGILYGLAKNKLPKISFLLVPILWVLIEGLRSSGFLGFPWGVIGYSQSRNTTLIQMADITGVLGISFIIILSNTLIFEVFFQKLKKRYLLLIPLIFFFLIIYGKVKLRENFINKKDLKVSIIQANINPDWYDTWDNHRNEVLRNLVQKTKEAATEHPDLIIWTETALHDLWEVNREIRPAVLELAKKYQTNLLIGIPHIEFGNQGNNKYFNSAFLINKEGKTKERYDKVHLVPFGEMIPFEKALIKLRSLFPFLPLIRNLFPKSGDFSSGKGFIPLNLCIDNNKKIKFGVLICFEGIFGYITQSFINKQANFVVNITNDAWSKNISSHLQHFEMSLFRVIENRCFLVRAANSGISAIINPYGKIENSLGVYKEGILGCKISTKTSKTFYNKYRNVFSYLGLILGIALLLVLFILPNNLPSKDYNK